MSDLKRLPFFLLTAVASGVVAYPAIFSIFQATDDEGYMLISLRGYLDVGNLYDRVYSQYGPFFFEFWGGLFSVLGIDPGHDSGRIATMLIWVAVSLVIGFTVYRVTDSVVLGLCVQLLAFLGLGKFVNEPMHPGGLICLALVVIAFAATAVDRAPRAAWGVIGGATAALLLIKVNVGAFAVLGIALACVAAYPELRRWRWLRPSVELLCLAVPLLLMSRQLDVGWVRAYVVHATIAIAALVIALRVAGPLGARIGVGFRWLAIGFAGIATLTLAVALLTGSSVADLARGIVVEPLRLPDVFSIEFGLEQRFIVIDLLALALCAGFAVAGSRPGPAPRWLQIARAVAGLTAGILIGVTAAGGKLPLIETGFEAAGLWPLSLAWIALLPTVAEDRSGTEFARRLLPALAVLGALHAYPVAGTQVQWAAFLLLPVAAIAFDNGRRDLAELVEDRSRQAVRAATAALAAFALVLIANAAILRPLGDARDRYNAGRALPFAGAERLHLPPADADAIESVVAELHGAECDTFLSEPGLNSFYLWSGIDPPTYINATDWMLLFDEPKQSTVVSSVSDLGRVCQVRAPVLAALWPQGRPVPQRSLIRYLESGFAQRLSAGPYEVSIRSADGTP